MIIYFYTVEYYFGELLLLELFFIRIIKNDKEDYYESESDYFYSRIKAKETLHSKRIPEIYENLEMKNVCDEKLYSELVE